MFLDLRDRTGLVQIVVNGETSPEAYKVADAVRNEYVLSCEGTLMVRPDQLVNPNIPTGRVEVVCERLDVLNASKTPPIYIEDSADADESVRLKYRYIDLRRPVMYRSIALRHKIAKAVRDFLDTEGFLEIETPMLTRSTPEGARDYLVPSRVNPGAFYALPQSPQLYKQILMVSGFERYFQIVRCFRDEDLRADRQPEFTQIDIEMSFVESDDVLSLTERLVAYLYERTLGIKLSTPFERLTYDDAIARYGSDKPDLRFGMQIRDLSEVFKNSDFRVFSDALSQSGAVRAICVPGLAHLSRKELDELVGRAKALGAKGLLWAAYSGTEVRSSFGKFISEQEQHDMRLLMDASDGDLLLIAAGPASQISTVLGGLRVELARRLGVTKGDEPRLCWVTQFPLFEKDSEGNITSSHHPFTSPSRDSIPVLQSKPLAAKSDAYDLVINGMEIAGGSIRIHDRALQEQVFSVLGLSASEARDKFGFLLDAFEFGAPPHGGIAFGLDRLVMVMAGRDTIRDVIAFPKTTSASELMTGAPSAVAEDKLRELHLKRV